MLRVLMVLEDYGELMFLQTILKKIGFDVDAIQNPRSFQDSLLTMNPDVLIMTAHGKRVNGLELASTVRKNRGIPHILLIKPAGTPQTDDENIEGWLDSPVSAMSMLNEIAEMCGLNKDVLAEKFQKLRLQEDPEAAAARVLHLKEQEEKEAELAKNTESSGNFTTVAPSTMSPEERKQRYAKVLADETPDKVGFSVKQVQEQIKSLRKEENPEDLAELERQRKLFVQHLFDKKKS